MHEGHLPHFVNGETRLIYARIGRDPGGLLVELPQGEADSWRARTQRELYCPFPGCARPELKVVKRAPRRRDGFSHLPGAGGHSAESLFHLQSKARIAAWVSERYPDFDVVIEQASNADRERVADVMVTAPDGHRWALEVQYAALTPTQWRARSDSYRRQGITDVWLFGHTGAQMRLKPATGSAERFLVHLTSAQSQMRELDRQVLWLNPLTGELATAAANTVVGDQTYRVFATEYGELQVMDLADCVLTPRGIDTADLVALRQSGTTAAEHRKRLLQERRVHAAKSVRHLAAEAEELRRMLAEERLPLTEDEARERRVREVREAREHILHTWYHQRS